MKMKSLKSENTVETWVVAYEEKVSEILGYADYHLKPSAIKHVERLKNMYPTANPYTFFEATFPPNTWWGTPKKGGGWIKLKYPFINMLVGKKAEVAYKNYIRQRKKEMGSKQEEILDGVKKSIDKLKVLNVKLDDFSELFYFTVDGTVSIYLTCALKGIFTWYILNCHKGESDIEYYAEVKKALKYLDNHVELKKRIRKLLEKYDGRD